VDGHALHTQYMGQYPVHDCETDARGSMSLAIYKGGTCTKALIMDITTYLLKLYQSKEYKNYFKVCQPCAAFNPFSEQSRDNNRHGSR